MKKASTRTELRAKAYKTINTSRVKHGLMPLVEKDVTPAPGALKTVLVLRTCAADMTSYNGFKWPTSGMAEAPDWRPLAECGNGLHGFLRGEGDGSLASSSERAKWLVVRVLEAHIVELNGKVKFPRGEVVYCGDKLTATNMIAVEYPTASVIGASRTAGDYGQATAGDYGQATAGYAGKATARYAGQATAGYAGQATAGNSGKATAGYAGKATAGYAGKATAGDYGQATAGDYGQATAGEKGLLALGWWDTVNDRRRLEVAYIGEGGIKPGTTYKLDVNHKFVEVVT